MNPISHLEKLEAESIYILREVAVSFENPVMLYSIGKDSAVMLHLALKAFAPGKIPFNLLHVDTTWKFREMINFRDQTVKNLNLPLIVHINQDGLKNGIGPQSHGSKLHTDIMKTEALKQALDSYKFDAALGGARRDEEKSRSKERIFSFRTSTHSWNSKNQRPELWFHFNTQLNKGESVRVFPLSNWTELDVWHYIKINKIPIVPLYFAKVRPVVKKNNQLDLQNSIWKVKYYVDDFGDYTNEGYISTFLNGTFSNSATTNSDLGVRFIIDKQVALKLYEYNRNHPVSGKISTQSYRIMIKHNGKRLPIYKGSNSSDRIIINKKGSREIIRLLKTGGEFIFKIEEITQYSSADYLFKIENSYGFESAWNELYNCINPDDCLSEKENQLSVESVAIIGDKSFVIISGKRFGVGDRIHEMVIQKITEDSVIFNNNNERYSKALIFN